MSSIASPTTTTRRAAILVNSCSRWSRVGRGSGVGIVNGVGSRQRTLVAEAVAQAHAAEQPRPRVATYVLKVRDAMHAGVEAEAHAAARRERARQRSAQRPLDDALKDRRGRGGRRLERMWLARVALALPQKGELRCEQ